MKGRALIVSVLILAGACSPTDPAAGEDSPTTTTVTGEPGAPDPTTSTTSGGPITTLGLYAPKEIAFNWNCEQVDRQDAFALSCSAPNDSGTPPEFGLGYWNTIVNFEHNDDGERIAMTFGAGTYNGNCTWGVDPVGFVTAPIENGIATFNITMLGDGHCEGLRYVMTGTWNLNTMEIDVDGHTEYVD